MSAPRLPAAASSGAVPYLLLDAGDLDGLDRCLRAMAVLAPDERLVAATKAGEGNMNLALRVTTSARSVVVKQARPWVEKYPQIPAPDERALVEAAFYGAVQGLPAVADRMPRLLGVDARNRVLVLDDLGPVADCTPMYQDGAADVPGLSALVAWLSALHAAPLADRVGADGRDRLANRAMRRLNHEHLFVFPLRPDNGLDLDGITHGLQAEAARLQQHAAYVAAVADLGERYLADGPALLHGDFFPGSWVRADSRVYVIDPEFGFFGPPEFDLGVLLAHLLLAQRPERLLTEAVAAYDARAGVDWALTHRFAGVEIMRRLIGVAQLPVANDLAYKAALLRRSEQLIRTGTL
ncbi:MAG: phosphotransferase [Bacteroidota bacterium]